MAYEGMNNAGSMDTRLIVVLNDNEMSIAPPVGAMSGYLSRLISSKRYRSIRDIARHAAERFPRVVEHGVKRVEKYARGLVTGGTLFEELGLLLRGGRSMDTTSTIFCRSSGTCAMTSARGRSWSTSAPRRARAIARRRSPRTSTTGVSSFDVGTGTQKSSSSNAPSFTKVFAQSLVSEARLDDRICAIHGRDAFGNRGRSLRAGLPRTVLRRRACGAARGDLRGGAWPRTE